MPSFLLIPRHRVGYGDSVALPAFTSSQISVVDEAREGWAKNRTLAIQRCYRTATAVTPITFINLRVSWAHPGLGEWKHPPQLLISRVMEARKEGGTLCTAFVGSEPRGLCQVLLQTAFCLFVSHYESSLNTCGLHNTNRREDFKWLVTFFLSRALVLSFLC